MKKITIYQGDEYRAKIEKDFSESDIFAEVYPQAKEIVFEIIRGMEKYGKESENSGRYAARYQGLGKNIVIFCGARGQGKTSAMQTFVRCLDGTYLQEKRNLKHMPAFIEELQTNRFEVLDSIDPSAMDNNESILRVVLSRLFFHLNECYQKDKFENSMDFERERGDLTRLFQKCFDNIDYIKCGKSRDWEQDDLEILSQLGSSANLKKNLCDLIDKYLKLVSPVKDLRGTEGRYLVIPVDDADLATKKVFRLCEDIRNYLSIPNVIILMAADYDQLMNATYQKYLKQNRIRQQAAAGKYDKRLVEKDCYQMAAKYLEKLFPIGHRISLPKIENLITENYENIKFEYLISDHGEEKDAFENEINQCGNLQEQFIQLLYLRTGMILVNGDHSLHSFLPHTFRELTHFVKMFYDMETIDWEMLYWEEENVRNFSKEYCKNVAFLKKNIQMLKQYFLNYWCAKRLNASEMNTILKIDEASQKHQMKKVYRILRKHLEAKTEKETDETTYRNVMRNIVEKKIGAHSWLREAMILYYTLFLNEWFAAAMEEPEQFPKIGAFVEQVLDYPENMSRLKYKRVYKVHQFYIDIKCLAKDLGKDITQEERTCLNNFCVAVQNGRVQNAVDLFRAADGKVRLDIENLAKDEDMHVQFDVLHPLMSALIHRGGTSRRDWGEGTSMDDETDGHSKDGIPVLATIRNIIANYDVQMDLRESIRIWYDDILKETNSNGSWREICRSLYSTIDEKLRMYTNQDGAAGKIFNDAIDYQKSLLDKIFLCNEENRKGYIDNVLENIESCQQATSSLLDECGSDKDNIQINQQIQNYKRKINKIFFDNLLDDDLDADILSSGEIDLEQIIKKLGGPETGEIAEKLDEAKTGEAAEKPETGILITTGDRDRIVEVMEGFNGMKEQIEAIKSKLAESGSQECDE